MLWQFGVVFLMFEETKVPLHINAVTNYYVVIYKCPRSYNFMAREVSTLHARHMENRAFLVSFVLQIRGCDSHKRVNYFRQSPSVTAKK